MSGMIPSNNENDKRDKREEKETEGETKGVIVGERKMNKQHH